jgi:hypothetical protein
MVAFSSRENGAVAVADSLNKNQLQMSKLWSLGHESGWRLGEHLLLTEILPEALQIRAEEPDGCWDTNEWFNRAIDTIHRMSQGLTDGLVDFEFMRAALKIAGFSLMTDVTYDDRHPSLHVGSTSGQTHFLEEGMADRYISQSFNLELKANRLIPAYTRVQCMKRESLDSLLGSYDDIRCRNSASYEQWLLDVVQMPMVEAVKSFSWEVEDYLHSRLHERRYPAKH